MLLGTARSEKHLHVTADKLCRWLRTEYKLSPYADGLLGRNEIKLRLRRRAKRTRLISAAAKSSDFGNDSGEADAEDGIRTGWVCVHIGRVEGGELASQSLEDVDGVKERRVVGFGEERGGSTLVVQMLTEEKRGEVDLERLWMGISRRAEKERVKDDLAAREQEDGLEGEADVDGLGEEGGGVRAEVVGTP